MDEQTTAQPNDKKFASEYGGLGHLLHFVRWAQHLLAIIAEVLILLSFAMSGMDVSLGGTMASIPLLKILWAAMFALGIDTAFALSWVRVRQCVNSQRWWPLAWNMILALSMSFIIFQPIAVQLLQQSLDVSFNQAVSSLGINIVFLTYARSAVAVFLGAILAMTNVEGEPPAQLSQEAPRPKRQFILISRLFQQPEPVTSTMVNEEQPAPALEVPTEPPVTTEEPASEQVIAPEQQAEEPAQIEPSPYDTPEQRVQKVSEVDFTGLSAPERVAEVLQLFPDLSDRELGKLSGVAAATAKKHRETLKTQTASEVTQ
jgi:hypothetical protein